MRAATDAQGRFDRRVFWDAPGTVPPQPLPIPDAFDVEVVDGSGTPLEPAVRVVSDGENLVVDSGIAPDERPLATAQGRTFTEVADLAAFLAQALAEPRNLGQISLSRPFLRSSDSTAPTPPEKLFRHFGTLLDRLQAAYLASRRHSPGFDPKKFDLMVPLGFQPLEKLILATLYWHPNLSAPDRVAKLVASFAGAEVTEEVLRRNVSRLVDMLGKILRMPIEYRANSYLWEDMAVILTLFTGIGLVAQRNHIVWADFSSNATGREIVLSML